MTLTFRRRAFLLCFLPVAALLTLTFATVQLLVQRAVRESLRGALQRSQAQVRAMETQSRERNNGLLRVAGENVALKAGVQLALQDPGSRAARSTLEDQLTELGEHMGFGVLTVIAPDGRVLASVERDGRRSDTHPNGRLRPVRAGSVPLGDAGTNGTRSDSTLSGYAIRAGHVLEIGATPLDIGDEHLADLLLGRAVDLSEYPTPVVLLDGASPVASNLPAQATIDLPAALRACSPREDCTLRLGGDEWVAQPVDLANAGGYRVLSLQNMDATLLPVRRVLNRVFAVSAFAALLIAVVVSLMSARSTERPIQALVQHLRRAAATGEMTAMPPHAFSVHEIDELATSYNRAAAAVVQATERLNGAYLESIESLATALDCRDEYTAGHSHRVSAFSRQIAEAMDLPSEAIERIRIGALLHDIGKIGVPDSILQKSEMLTDEEVHIVRQHPTIGRRIMEGVQGFTPFLDAVELHHENWDGSGYPHGQRGVETPIEARIIHISDAFDAMTTNRSYRRGMSRAQALRILQDNAGVQFDPPIVAVFLRLMEQGAFPRTESAAMEVAV